MPEVFFTVYPFRFTLFLVFTFPLREYVRPATFEFFIMSRFAYAALHRVRQIYRTITSAVQHTCATVIVWRLIYSTVRRNRSTATFSFAVEIAAFVTVAEDHLQLFKDRHPRLRQPQLLRCHALRPEINSHARFPEPIRPIVIRSLHDFLSIFISYDHQRVA